MQVGAPSEEARAAILSSHVSKLPLMLCNEACPPACTVCGSLQAKMEFARRLAGRTGGMSGAELVHVCRLAAMCAMRRDAISACILPGDFDEALQGGHRGDYA